MYENSDTFRNYVGLERYGVSPTLTFFPSKDTKITLGTNTSTMRAARTAEFRPSKVGRS